MSVKTGIFLFLQNVLFHSRQHAHKDGGGGFGVDYHIEEGAVQGNFLGGGGGACVLGFDHGDGACLSASFVNFGMAAFTDSVTGFFSASESSKA